MKKSLLTVAGLVVACSSWGAQSAANAAETPAEKLANLQAQKTLNKVRLDIAKQEAEMSEAQQKKAGSAPPPPAAPSPVPKITKPVELPPPSLLSISSVGDKFTATVVAAGMRKAARVGDVLAGGWVVEKLDTASMTVSRNGQTQVLRP